jgi:hypothetical protein
MLHHGNRWNSDLIEKPEEQIRIMSESMDKSLTDLAERMQEQTKEFHILNNYYNKKYYTKNKLEQTIKF